MAYRGPVDSVLQRCEGLRERLATVQRRPVAARECPDLGAALAWERELRARLDTLDARALEDAPIDAVAHPVVIAPVKTWSSARTLVFAVLAVATLVVFVVQCRP